MKKFKSRLLLSIFFLTICLSSTTPSFSSVTVTTQESKALQVEIQTERLYLRSINENDYKYYLSTMQDPENMKNYGTGPRTAEEILQRTNFLSSFWKNGNPFSAFAVFLKDTDTFIGDVLIIDADLGYFVDRLYWRKGYAYEMANAIMTEYIPELKKMGFQLQTITATAHPENVGSIKVLEKLGFQFTHLGEKFGKPRNYYFCDTGN